MAMLAWLRRPAAVVAAVGAMVLGASCGGSMNVTHATLRPCATSALHVAFGLRVDHFTGHVARSLDFSNRSGAACTLAGYPAVWFVTAPGGRQVGAVASRISGRVRRVVLAPGGRAQSLLVLLDVPYFGPRCPLRPVWGLRVAPPGQRAARYIALPGRECAGPRPTFMGVGPVGRAVLI
jgi:uncharacterized protein DUF4232